MYNNRITERYLNNTVEIERTDGRITGGSADRDEARKLLLELNCLDELGAPQDSLWAIFDLLSDNEQ